MLYCYVGCLLLKKKNQKPQKEKGDQNISEYLIIICFQIKLCTFKKCCETYSVKQSCYLYFCPLHESFTDPIVDYGHGLVKRSFFF